MATSFCLSSTVSLTVFALLCSCFVNGNNVCGERARSTHSTGAIYDAYLNPSAIINNANFGEPYTLNSHGELVFHAGTTLNGRLFRIPLCRPNRLSGSETLLVDVTYSNKNPISPTTDMDPHFMLSDGVKAVGFEIRDKAYFASASPIASCEGTSGTFLATRTCCSENIRVTSDPPTVHSLHFRLQAGQPASGSCSGSYDRGVSVYRNYTDPLYFERGLYFEVYRDSPSEQYIFSYFRIQVHVESLAY
ncbi:uncharacterized protein LOC134182447 [Corticium candelabrum]|uniref:uncharacterized protein LOC134182447 n=1 Tax=Corticium candelabrum TaxID=121492 RepID=UPI002E25EB4E|nr:uncharacterized protein LOC134182447 [Corticium candelabrum]